LCDDYGYYSTNDNNFTGPTGAGFEFAKVSDEEGFIVFVMIDYDSSGYTLTLTRGKGTLTIPDPAPADPEPVEPVEPEEPQEPEDPADAGPAPGEVDIIVPAMLAGGTTVEEVESSLADPDIKVVDHTGNSFTYRMTEAKQQQMIESTKQETEDIIIEIYQSEAYIGIEDIEYSDDFSEINFIVTEEFFADDNVGLNFIGLLAVGFTAPKVQVYEGKGFDSKSTITLTDAASGEVLRTIMAPDEIISLFGETEE
jgi:hypothetical protein